WNLDHQREQRALEQHREPPGRSLYRPGDRQDHRHLLQLFRPRRSDRRLPVLAELRRVLPRQRQLLAQWRSELAQHQSESTAELDLLRRRGGALERGERIGWPKSRVVDSVPELLQHAHGRELQIDGQRRLLLRRQHGSHDAIQGQRRQLRYFRDALLEQERQLVHPGHRRHLQVNKQPDLLVQLRRFGAARQRRLRIWQLEPDLHLRRFRKHQQIG